MATKSDFSFKILLLGDSGSGKTSLLLRYAEDSFADSYTATVGVDFKVRMIKLEGKDIRLQLWDTAGQERFRTVTSTFYRNAAGVAVIYDVTDRSTFKNVEKWVRDFGLYAPGSSALLVGNKIDREEDRTVDTEEGAKKAMQNKMEFQETSAKLCTNVDRAFEMLVADILKKKLELSRQQNALQVADVTSESDKKCACPC